MTQHLVNLHVLAFWTLEDTGRFGTLDVLTHWTICVLDILCLGHFDIERFEVRRLVPAPRKRRGKGIKLKEKGILVLMF